MYKDMDFCTHLQEYIFYEVSYFVLGDIKFHENLFDHSDIASSTCERMKQF